MRIRPERARERGAPPGGRRHMAGRWFELHSLLLIKAHRHTGQTARHEPVFGLSARGGDPTGRCSSTMWFSRPGNSCTRCRAGSVRGCFAPRNGAPACPSAATSHVRLFAASSLDARRENERTKRGSSTGSSARHRRRLLAAGRLLRITACLGCSDWRYGVVHPWQRLLWCCSGGNSGRLGGVGLQVVID